MCVSLLGCTPERQETESVHPTLVTAIVPETKGTYEQLDDTDAVTTTEIVQTEQQRTSIESTNATSIPTEEMEYTEENIPESYVVDVSGNVGIGGT